MIFTICLDLIVIRPLEREREREREREGGDYSKV